MKIGLFLLTIIIVVSTSAGEPSYEGKTAKDWIEQGVKARFSDDGKAIDALREIGPEAALALANALAPV